MTKIIRILILSLFFLSSIFLIFNPYTSSQRTKYHIIENQVENQVKKPRTSAEWILTSPIQIIDTDPNHNWTKTATDNDWCSGSGTYNDPFVINNVSINTNSEYSIAISSSDVFFKIINCNLSNSEYGIRLNKANNGTIEDCYFTNHSQSDIDSSNTERLKILKNNFTSSRSSESIYLYNCNHTIIEENSFSHNSKGISQWINNPSTRSINLTIRANSFLNISDEAIRCEFIDNVLIEDNEFRECLDSFNSESIKNLVFQRNTLKNIFYAFRLSDGENINISQNIIINHSLGIAVFNTILTSIYSNTIKESEGNLNYPEVDFDSAGIVCFQSPECDIYNNIIKDNLGAGLGISNSNNSAIYDNTFSNNSVGIISGVQMSPNPNNSTYLKIHSNEFIKNDNSLELLETYNSYILNNDFSYSQEAILIHTSSVNNTLFNNTLVHNLLGIDVDSTSTNNLFYSNYFDNTLNAICNSENNWYYGMNGNYWGDYDGEDADDDGIGDTPYIISGSAFSEDKYPIWDDGLNILTPFNLTSYADTPDNDGIFWILWTRSENANNYSIYYSKEKISPTLESLSQLTLFKSNLTELMYLMNFGKNGTYYIVVVAFNEYGFMLSNSFKVQIGEDKVIKEDNFTNNLLIIFIISIIGGISATIIFQYWFYRKKHGERKKTRRKKHGERSVTLS